MGTFTVSSNSAIDVHIRADMDIICDEIRKTAVPDAIILAGSFGRGEGSVIQDNGRIVPLNDYDIILVVGKKLAERQLDEIRGNICDRLGYQRPETRENPFEDFTISLFQTSAEDICSYANVGSYEIKTRSVLLWGTDIRGAIPLTIADIPVATGLHFLFNKVLQLTGSFSEDFLTTPPEGRDRIILLYACAKTYIEIGTALCLLGGIYRPGFAERNEVLGREFERLFPDLAQKSPGLAAKIDRFTRQKLAPDPDVFHAADPVALWFEARQDLADVLKYFLERQYGISCGEDVICLSERLYTVTKADYFRGQFRYFIRARTGIDSSLLAAIANRLYQRYTALEFYWRSRGRHRNTPRVLIQSPILKIFSLAPVLLLALRRNGGTDERLMAYFTGGFREIQTTGPVPGTGNTWTRARASLIAASRTYGRLR